MFTHPFVLLVITSLKTPLKTPLDITNYWFNSARHNLDMDMLYQMTTKRIWAQTFETCVPEPLWWRASADEMAFYWGNRTVRHVPKRTKGLTAWLNELTLVSPRWAWMCWITWSSRLTGHNHRQAKQGPLILYKHQKHLEMINMKLADYFSLESLANLLWQTAQQ